MYNGARLQIITVDDRATAQKTRRQQCVPRSNRYCSKETERDGHEYFIFGTPPDDEYAAHESIIQSSRRTKQTGPQMGTEPMILRASRGTLLSTGSGQKHDETTTHEVHARGEDDHIRNKIVGT
jgi:hypothetical protein